MKRRNNYSWLDATKFVLSKSEGAMCHTQILQKISDLGLKDTRVPNSGELVMRALLANSSGKNPIICKVEDKKFVINDNYKATIYSNDNFCTNKRQLPQRKKAKAISDDFVDSDSLIHAKEEKVSYSPYSSNIFDHARKNKRMRTKPAVTVPRSSIKPSILLKESVNSTVQPSAETRAAVQEMLNGNSDIMKYDVIAKKCLNMDEFMSLSKCQQRYLTSLLPSSDVRKERNSVKLEPTALSNSFFASYFREWQDKLGKGELSVEFAAKIKTEADKQVSKDPWKETFFEDVWGFSRAEQAQTSKSRSSRQWHDPFEDHIKEALSLVPSSFFIAPPPDPLQLQETLTPPTSDGSEHDRSHTLNPDIIDKDLQILTPDHEIDRGSEKLELDEKVPQNHSVGGFDSDVLEDPETPENSMIEAGIDILFKEEARTKASESLECKTEIQEEPQKSNQSSPKNETDTCKEDLTDASAQGTASISDDILLSPEIKSDSVEESLSLDTTKQVTSTESVEKVQPQHQNGPTPCIGKIKLVITMGGQKETVETEAVVVPHSVDQEDSNCDALEVSETSVSPVKASPSKSLEDLDLDLDLDDSMMGEYEVAKKLDTLDDIDDPELNCDFINDKSCDIKIEKQQDEPSFVVRPADEASSETVTKLAVSDDISLNIMNEIKVDLKIPERKVTKVDPPPPAPLLPPPVPLSRQNGVEVPASQNSYNSPSASSSTSSSPRTDSERREKLTLRIPVKDIVLNPETVLLSKKLKSKKRKSKSSYYYSEQSIPSGHIPPYLGGGYSPDMYGMYSEEESETDLRRISIQQQLLAEKGIKTSSIPVEQTQNLVKNMREKQQTQALPKLTKAPLEAQLMIVLDSGTQRAPSHKSIPVIKEPSLKSVKPPGTARQPPPYSRSDNSESIRSALKAKINQRRYTDMPSPPAQYPNQSSGNHCCYVVKGSPGECVCSTAPMLFCTKCYHLSHSTCSNILCSNCGALFKFN
ncbi:hypothetical protein ACHWQZ_G007818 [Mnemiopsis leidyi]